VEGTVLKNEEDATIFRMISRVGALEREFAWGRRHPETAMMTDGSSEIFVL
jgi:hypothetical protein